MAPKSLKARTKKKVSKKFFFQKGQVGTKILVLIILFYFVKKRSNKTFLQLPRTDIVK